MDRNGKPVLLKQPVVDLELCTGCGICETKCPVGGRGSYICCKHTRIALGG